ncbi:MAG: ATP-dependent DNA helicase RecG [Candidatus Berkelbacteria bacterium]|nr:ATP-dependent DNA helicase RecG [Candidatus Berkelbacteria bacterium]
MLNLDTKVENMVGVGPKTALKLQKLGIEKVSDLLYHFPARYDDLSKVTRIADVKVGQTCCIEGKIVDIKNQRSPKKRIFITHALLSDQAGSIKAIWFNRPFLTRVLKRGENIILAGKLEYGPAGIYLNNPIYEKEAGILPVYPETEGLNSKYLRKLIKSAIHLASQINDFLPNEVKKHQNLIDIDKAIRQIHFPTNQSVILRAKSRLAFDELFLLQIKMLKMRKDWQENKAPKMIFDKKTIQSLVKKLPFRLTDAQRKAAWEILLDLQKDIPMNRLLEGDVGSGKTIVAAIAMLVVAKNKYQSLLLVPTEILAIQHFGSLIKVFSDFNIKVGLLTQGKNEINGHKVQRKELLEKIQEGRVDVVVGTHALLQEKVSFNKLGLAIVDEQHRFGVEQRATLRRKSFAPHLLSMSATPIPRSLSLAMYGDLDLSILDEMPKGRQKVKTFFIPPNKRESAYRFVTKQIKNRRQVFVICPLIEESDKLGVKAATKEYQKLKKEIFPEYSVGLLHGKMKTKEKETAMHNFKSGKYAILVSTAVVEVGVDIPNATVMIIEGADRFGLAQLHQFRGRVGRGKHQSYCFLFSDSSSEKTKKRLLFLVKFQDGFKLAEQDLEIRGPGELYGIKQHGFWDFKMASLKDVITIQKARKEAKNIMKSGLESYPAILSKIKEFEAGRKLE